MKLKIKAILANMGMNAQEFSKVADIPYNHFRGVMSGATKMTAYDLVKIQEVTKLDFNEISIEQ